MTRPDLDLSLVARRDSDRLPGVYPHMPASLAP